MSQLFTLIFLQVILLSCNNNTVTSPGLNTGNTTAVNPYKQIKAIPLPDGFERIKDDSGSFTGFLRNINLKENTTVHLFNGQPKRNQSAQYALLDISTGNKDLQQCADAVMRLRAEYQFAQKQFEQIVFYDNNKTAYTFSAPFTRERFNKYLNRVFGMCGSASLSKQLKPVNSFSQIQSGDVLIRGGFPGHAVIVIDVAVNNSGKKIYLLAQSYMPAQDIHVLKNPANTDMSPWYEVNDDMIILTPEYTFMQKELMRW
jgi:maltoporin